MIVIALLVLSAPPAWCADAQTYAARGPDSFEMLLATLPPEARPVASRVRELDEKTAGRGFELAVAAVRAGCDVPTEAPAADAAARVQKIIDGDARFGGVRSGDDVIDRIEHKIYLWVLKFLESSGMQAYSSSARTIYLGFLALVATVIAVRLVRKIVTERAERARKAGAAGGAVLEKKRKRAFAAWREEAERALAAGRAREALRAGQAALLARVGELDTKAVNPARTHREILARLHSDVAARVRDPLVAFDVAWFGKDAAVDDARAFLTAVDAAEKALGASA